MAALAAMSKSLAKSHKSRTRTVRASGRYTIETVLISGSSGRMSADPGEADLTLEPSGKRVVGVGQLKSDADRGAGRIEHLIDDGHDRSVLATDLRVNLRRSAKTDSAEMAQREIYFDVERIDLGHRDEVPLIEGIFTWAQRPGHDDAIDWAADRPLLENFAGASQFQLRQL